jgi:hypothetical protein
MPTHTPGPWTENACEIQAEDGSPICEMLARPEDSGVNYPHSPVADANSRLICAAPDLLNLSKLLASALESMLSDEPPWHREEEYRQLINEVSDA